MSVVLAGGSGSRLMPLTADRAKPAVPFGGKYRLIDFAISNLVNGGFRHIIVLTQYKSHSLDVHISLTWQLSNILGNFVTTVPAQMRRGPHWFSGSADALYQNMNIIEDEKPHHIIVLGADHIYRFNPRQMLDEHRDSGAGVTVACTRVPESEASSFGVVELEPGTNRIVAFHEKNPDAPRLADDPNRVLASMGNYIFETETFREIMHTDASDSNSKHDIGGNIIPKLVSEGKAYMYDYTTNQVPGDSGSDSHYWRDVGTLDAFYEAHMDLVAPLPQFTLYNDQWPIYTTSPTEPPAKISSGNSSSSNVDNCILSNGVIVSGSQCTNSVISQGVRMREADVQRSVLMSGVRVGKGARIRNAIIDKGVEVPEGFEIGYDLAADAERFHTTDSGIVVIPKNHKIE